MIQFFYMILIYLFITGEMLYVVDFSIVAEIPSGTLALVVSNANRRSVFFDLRKAFASVPHRWLVDKLTLACLNPYILRWIIFYLSNGKQYVILNGE